MTGYLSRRRSGFAVDYDLKDSIEYACGDLFHGYIGVDLSETEEKIDWKQFYFEDELLEKIKVYYSMREKKVDKQ